ncbi:hypothetical protein AAHC03_05394 [Spirometra sp. Aus1]
MMAIANQASMYNYLNMNNFFWIDGCLLNSSCNPSKGRCTWGPEMRRNRVVSHITPGVSNTFETAHVACKKMANDEITNDADGESTPWPVLMPNLQDEFPNEDKDYVLAVAPNFEKTGFICSAPNRDAVECPYGLTRLEVADVPQQLIPKPVSSLYTCE